MKAKLEHIARQYPRFAAVYDKWTDKDVEHYLAALSPSSILRVPVLETLRADTGFALVVGYHERVEMDAMGILVDYDFLKAVKERRLSTDMVHFWSEKGYSYFIAHYQASEEEINFARALATSLRFTVTPEALIATKPTYLEDQPQISLEEIYAVNMKRQLGREKDLPQFPKRQEMKEATRFWKTIGGQYSVETAILAAYEKS